MDVVRIGILGTARIAEKALIAAARVVPDVTVAAVAARDAQRADVYAVEHGIPAAYGSYDELLADPGVDAIYNPLPNSLHGPWTLQAIAAGKHVLCEKPFASNATEAELVATAAATSRLVVMEAMHYRYHPMIGQLREAVHSLGKVQHIQAWTSFTIRDPDDIRYDYALGGGALMDGGCYAADCIRMLAGEEPSVTGAVADTEPGGLVDRATAVRLAFPGGATAWFESAFTRDGDFRADVHVVCERGTVWVRNFIAAHDGELFVTPDEPAPAGDAEETEEPSAGAGLGLGSAADTTFAWQLRTFARAVTAGAAVETSAENAVATMRVIDDAYRAAGLTAR
jgi:predicted dehydrogenase